MDLLRRVREEVASGRMYTIRDWLAEHPPPDDAFRQTLATVARVPDVRIAVKEFLDEFQIRPDRLRQPAIDERPDPTGDQRWDAYLAALAEHLAALHDLARPAWCCEPDRFLDRFWFVGSVPAFRAMAIAESPAAFRRRGIFISRGSLVRY